MMDFDVLYAEQTGKQHGLSVVRRPTIRAAEERIIINELPGREADLSQRSGQYQDAQISVEFNYFNADPARWGSVYRQATLWLRQPGHLQFTDDLDVFYKVRYVQVGEDERTIKRFGKFTANFICKPGVYYTSGLRFADLAQGGSLINYYSQARPIYTITGNGQCTLTVNGKMMQADNTADTLTIDTDLKIAYQVADTMRNTSVTGDYDDLILVPGVNNVSVSSGFRVRVRPNWRVL